MPQIQVTPLRVFAAELLAALGLGPDEAGLVAEHLVDANLCGHDSHGVIRLRGYAQQVAIGELVPGADLQVLTATPAVLHVDGQLGFGPVQMQRLNERLAAMARQAGVSSGSLRRCGHIGRLGYYCDWFARHGLVSLIAVNDNGVCRNVAPPGGLRPRISTNPLAFGIPGVARTVVFDSSTSVVAHGKILVRRDEGQRCPEGWIQDAQGHPATDPHVLLADPPGTLLPLGGVAAYKGFGLGLMVDLLAAGMSGGFCPPAPAGEVDCNNVLVTVWDPARWGMLEHLAAESERLASWINEPPLRLGVEHVDLPGERSAAIRQQRLEYGIPLADKTWQGLLELAAQHGIEPPLLAKESS
ncbi:MAG: Ldh family oxidoreductase [Pirellulales bacterium]|nr:Ldh family oxidoreductase [Pirellulales bacterium]